MNGVENGVEFGVEEKDQRFCVELRLEVDRVEALVDELLHCIITPQVELLSIAEIEFCIFI